MHWPNPDIIIFSCFLTANLILGLQAGRRVKSLQSYAIGNKDFSTATITSTIVATCISGGFLSYVLAGTYSTGLSFMIALVGMSLGRLITGQLLVVRMGEFLNNLSVAEAMGDLYGKTVRIVTAISGIAVSVGYVAVQFQMIGGVLTLIFGSQELRVTMAAAIIVIGYSAFGGIRSVTITDVFQFITFGVFIPALSLIVWNNLKDPSQVVHTLTTNPSFDLREVIGWNPQFLFALSLLFYWTIPGMNPSSFQRIAMAHDLRQSQRSFNYAAGLTFLISMATVWVAILVLTENSNLNVASEPKAVLGYLINRYTYAGFKGLVAVGIVAMAMSTADSYLNSSAVLAVNDVIAPLRHSFKASITVVRLLSLCIGSLSLLLALHAKDLLELMLLAGSLYMPVVTIPLLLAIFGFRSSTRAVLIGMFAGISTVIFWNQFMAHTGIKAVIPGMVGNLVFLMGSHYLLRETGGWVGIKVPGPLVAARQGQRMAWQSFFHTIRHPQIYCYLKKNLPVNDGLYFLFGLYVIGATYASFSTVASSIVETDNFYYVIAQSVLFPAAVFITYPAWPPTFRVKWFIAFAWPLGIGYILFFVGGVLVLMSGFHQVQVIIFMLNLVMTALLLDWPLMLFLAGSGFALALGIFQVYAGAIPWETAGDMRFRAIYGLPLFISLLVALIRFRQVRSRLTLQNAYLTTSRKEARRQLTANIDYGHQLARELERNEAHIGMLATAHVKQAVYRIIDYIQLDVSEIRVSTLLEKVKAELELQDFKTPPQLIVRKNVVHKSIQADVSKIQQMLIDALVDIHKRNTANQPITIALDGTTLGSKLKHMDNYLKKLPAIRFVLTLASTPLPKQTVYMINPIQPKSESTEEVLELAMLENLRIVDAHYGYAAIEEATTHVYVLPVNVREVRAKVMERLRIPAASVPAELIHPAAIQLEEELFETLDTRFIDLTMIQTVLATIKKYHGGTKRKSGEPFFVNSLEKALILLEYSQDQEAVVGALLLDTIEHTQLSLTNIRSIFGHVVASLIEKVANLDDDIERKMTLADHEKLARLVYYQDRRAALIKLSDRLHNLRRIKEHPSLAKQKKFAYETWIFFVPLALQLQLHAMASEMKDISVEVLERRC